MISAGQHQNADERENYSDGLDGRKFFPEKDHGKSKAYDKDRGVFNGICDRVSENGQDTQNQLKPDGRNDAGQDQIYDRLPRYLKLAGKASSFFEYKPEDRKYRGNKICNGYEFGMLVGIKA